MLNEQYPKIYLYRQLVQAKLFIDAHFAENINLNDIADEAYFSKFHFIRQFKTIYRKTPHQYLIFVRIRNAMTLLRQGMPVSEVCYAVGFESLSSFSGLFKRMTGTTPSEYLFQQQTLKEEMERKPMEFVPGCFAEKYGWAKNQQF